MRKILITGFEPFGGEKINPSEKTVLSLNDFYGDDMIIKKILPVEWNVSQKMLYEAIDEYSPDKLIMVGQAGGDNCIRIERVGINICGKIADVNGNYAGGDSAKETKIFDNGENAYFSSFDFDGILKKMNEEGIKARLSYSAGVYICNYVLYSALYKIKNENRKIDAGFIHVPYLEEQNKNCFMEFDLMKRAIEIAVEYC